MNQYYNYNLTFLDNLYILNFQKPIKMKKGLLFVLLLSVGFINLTFGQSINKLIENAQNAVIAGDYDKAISEIYQAINKKADNKKVVTAANTVIPSVFEAKENKITDLTTQVSNALNADEKYRLQGQIVEEYTDLARYASKLKYSPGSNLFSIATKEFVTKDYNAEKQAALVSLNDLKNASLEKHYVAGKKLLEVGIESFSDAEKELNQVSQLNPEYKNIKELYAEIAYVRGITAMEKGDRENFKQASRFFEQAHSHVSDYKDSRVKYSEAKKAATIRIAVFPFKNVSGVENVGAIGEFEADEIIKSIFNSEFVELISRDELSTIIKEQELIESGYLDENSVDEVGQIKGVNQIITGKITQIITNPEQVVKSNTPLKETKKVYVDDKGNVVDKLTGGLTNIINEVTNQQSSYKEVTKEAFVTTYTKKASAQLSCSYRLTDVGNGKILKSNSFTESFKFEHKWGTYKGSEHALSDSSKRLVKKTEQIAPSSVEMINKCAESSAKRIAKEVGAFLK